MSFQDIPGFVSAILLLIFSIFLLSLKKGKKLSNILLGLFFFFNVLNILGVLSYGYADNHSIPLIHFLTIGDAFSFLVAPVFYFYTKSITKPKFKFSTYDTAHLIPFIAFFIITIITFHSKDTETKYALLETKNVIGESFVFYAVGFLNLQIITYVGVSLVLLKNFTREVKAYFSSTRKINLSWLKLFFSGFIIINSIDLLNFIFNKVGVFPIFDFFYVNSFSLLLTLLFAVAIIFNGLANPEYFYGIALEREKEKIKESSLKSKTNNATVKKLLALMKYEKPYRNASLKLSELASMVEISSRQLSQILNESLNKNFYDFVNYYRIEEAKEMLKDENGKNKTILEVLYDSGFNSKSVFNTAFKKIVGMTPTEFKKSN